jgi:hypothetical protein
MHFNAESRQVIEYRLVHYSPLLIRRNTAFLAFERMLA